MNQNPPGADAGVIENKTEFMFPENFVLSPPARCPRMSDLWWSWDMMLKGAVPLCAEQARQGWPRVRLHQLAAHGAGGSP